MRSRRTPWIGRIDAELPPHLPSSILYDFVAINYRDVNSLAAQKEGTLQSLGVNVLKLDT